MGLRRVPLVVIRFRAGPKSMLMQSKKAKATNLMDILDYTLLPNDHLKRLGLIVLQSDITLEDEFRFLFADSPVNILVSRIPFETYVTVETLQEMRSHIRNSTSLFPKDAEFDCVAYCCTSGALHIGHDVIKELINTERHSSAVSNPMQAAVAAMKHINANRIGYISPYSPAVSQTMIDEFENNGVKVTAAATFDVHDKVVGHIDPQSTKQACLDMIQKHDIDAVFVSCTNTKCVSVIAEIEEQTGVTITSSNHALAWHIAQLTDLPKIEGKGKLFEC